MASQETFGLALRRARQHRGVTLAEIAAQTNVKVEFWEEIERNDFARWPSGIYARTWIRDYAHIVGLDPDKTIDDFCRWFPQGDRRAESTLREHAQIIGHDLSFQDELPPSRIDRRAPRDTPPVPARGIEARHIRLIASAADLSAITLFVMTTTVIVPVGRWTMLGFAAVVYYGVSLALLGCSPSVWAIEAYARRDPDFYRRGGPLPFRRLEQTQIPRGTASPTSSSV